LYESPSTTRNSSARELGECLVETFEPALVGLDRRARAVESLEHAELRARGELDSPPTHRLRDHVAGDADQPRGGRSGGAVAKAPPGLPSLRERLGRELVRSIDVANATDVETEDLAGIASIELAERRWVGARSPDQFCIGSHCASIVASR
jgi:hypothetical protein